MSRNREEPESPARERQAYAQGDDPIVSVGGEDFRIREMTPRQSFELDKLLSRVVGAVGAGSLDFLKGMVYEDKVYLVSLLLNSKERKIDMKWVDEHAKPVEMMRVLAVFLSRPDVKEYMGEAQSLLLAIQGRDVPTEAESSATEPPSPNGSPSLALVE